MLLNVFLACSILYHISRLGSTLQFIQVHIYFQPFLFFFSLQLCFSVPSCDLMTINTLVLPTFGGLTMFAQDGQTRDQHYWNNLSKMTRHR